jgi:hypothetical protein
MDGRAAHALTSGPQVAESQVAEADNPVAVVVAHLEAFEGRDLDGVLATFADDATFSTADGTVVGRRALRQLFTDAFALPAQVAMERHHIHVAGDTVVCEMTERITTSGMTHGFDVAGVYTVRDGRLVRVRVYRDATG